MNYRKLNQKYIILGIIVLIFTVPVIWRLQVNNFRHNDMQKSPSNFSLKHYQNSELKFSFDYPEFSDWHTEVINNQIRYIPDAKLGIQLEYPPFISIKILLIDGLFNYKTIVNPNGVPYVPSPKPANGSPSNIMFFLKDRYVEIAITKEEVYPNFSGQIIWDTIINSFATER